MKQLYLLFSLLMASAAVADDVTWTFDDCVEYALVNNISIKKSRLAEQTSVNNLEESKAKWEPTLDFATSQSYSNYPWNDGTKNSYNSSYGLNVGWTVWDGGQRENNIKRNNLEVEKSRLETDNGMRSVKTDLLQVYLNILYARESVTIYKDAVALSEQQADRARQLMERGRISRVDYAQIQSQLEQDRYSLTEAEGTYNARRMELKKILELGIDSNIELSAVDWTADQVMSELPPIAESYRMALINDLQLKGLEIDSEQATIDEAIAKAGRRPNIRLNAGVGTGYMAPGGSFGNGLKQAWNENIGITLSIPVFDNKKTKTAVANARVQQLNAELDLDSRKNELARIVENWYIDTRSAQSRYSAAGSQLESAQLTNELTNEQFKLGLVNPVELRTAHNNLVDARHSLLQAKYMAMLGKKMIEYYRTANVTIY